MHHTKPVSADIEAELQTAYTSGLRWGAAIEPHLASALRQTLNHPGSLVRAQMVYEIGLAFGLLKNHAIHFATAMEYFHTASLLFDDLPCMDDAAERRGQPCVHHTHGEATAILAALGLVSRAYALLWQGLANASAERQALAAAYIEKCLGVNGLLNGQSEDLHYASLPNSRRSPQQVATGKTVSLIRLSLVLPALVGGAKPREVRLLERLAGFWGLGYQILDDLKDVLQPSAQTGKTSARDQSLNRPNLALAIGADQSLRRLERLMGLGDRVLARLPTLNFLSEFRGRFQREILRIKTGNSSPA